jgi:hypothetical protein
VILSATGDYAAAEYQLERALAVARADDDGYFIAEGVQAVIKSWLAIGSIDHAVRIANDFSWNYDRACALQIIVRHCCDGGDTSRARSLIDAIDLPDLRAEALRHLAEYQATRNERGSVVAILASMNDVGLADQVLTSVVRGAAAGQQFEWAIQLSSKIQDPASAAEALLMVGHRKVDLGNPVGDEFDAAEAKISEVPDPKERSRLFWNLEQLNARIAPGPAMLERMNRLWWGVAGRDDGLKVIAETLGRRGFVMEALEAADRIASGYDSSRERGLALAYLARGVATRSVRA